MAFTDTAEPVSQLKAPKAPAEFSKGPIGDSVSTISDILSPSYWALGTVKFIFGTDPLEEALKWFEGDWESYAKCAEVWSNTGKMAKDVAANIRAGNKELDASWNGNAADAAYVYFDELAKKIASIEGDMDELKRYYTDVALAVSRGVDLVKGLLTQMADELIIAEVELAAGTALAETGVGAVIGYASAAIEIAKIIKTWGRITEAYSAAEEAINVATTASGAIVGRLGIALHHFPDPGRSYDNPAV
ncbi:hypothetical protein [Streptomyces auratus]|uniref:WXG100 family type VII secretion target n=1 Tax=Streptomyces auratus AGR0001 TaxID=1160718 RepID=J2A1G1_9ACTN|nr:hypothetical protein [Streptomyces auratus]QTZ94411.1 hypothetical protein SU9_025635 [Streptomyces auratus AGR0001]